MSITNWTRLEPDTQTNVPTTDMDEGVAARLADPLWLLGRQWQMGELSGEDAASPVAAHLEAASFPLDGLRIGTNISAYAAATTPVEAMVEHDGARPDERTRAAGGISLIERLDEADLDRVAGTAASHFPMLPGAPDGAAILAVLDTGSLPSNLGVTAAERPSFDAVVAEWAAWFRPRAHAAPNPAWIPDRMEYGFSMTATVDEGHVTLTAPEHFGDTIDWYTFRATGPAGSGASADPQRTTSDVTPTLLQIPGMPVLTFWEIEDPTFDPGRIEAAPTDTARLLLVEAALAISADWFLVPLRLPVASLSRIDLLNVTDTFGVTTAVRPADVVRPHDGWKLWRVSDLPYLMLPPPSTGFLASEPVERVAFVRDEDANLVWALQVLPPPPPPTAAAEWATEADYRYVPILNATSDRVPLSVVESGDGRTLVQGSLTGQAPGALEGVFDGMLRPGFVLRDEELPDEGLVLERRYELGTTPDGVLHLWASRTKRTGARAPASGLAFDRLR